VFRLARRIRGAAGHPSVVENLARPERSFADRRGSCERVRRDRGSWLARCLRKGLNDDGVHLGIAVESTASNAIGKDMAGSG